MITTILFRRGATDAWIEKNPVLGLGEPGLDIEARVLKLGDGTSPWLDLPGISVDVGVSDETIALAIESYLAENPIEGITQQQLDDAISAVELLPGPKGDPGDVGPASTVPGPKGDKGDKGDDGENPVGAITSDSVSHVETLSQAQYDAITPDPDTIYVIS